MDITSKIWWLQGELRYHRLDGVKPEREGVNASVRDLDYETWLLGLAWLRSGEVDRVDH